MKGTLHFTVDATDEEFVDVDSCVRLNDITLLDAVLLLYKFCRSLHLGKEELLFFLASYDAISDAADSSTSEVTIDTGAIAKAKEGLADG